MIKKFSFLILLILLVGCSERELVFDRTYPDSSRYDVIKAKKQAQQAEQAEQAERQKSASFLIASSFMPMGVNVFAENNRGYIAYPSNFCWKATYEECADLKFVDAFNDHVLRTNEVSYYLTFIANSKVTLSYINITSVNETMPMPDDIEIYIFNKDKTLTPYPSKKIDAYQYEIILPSEKTTYDFVFKTIYKKQIGGVTYYPVIIDLE